MIARVLVGADELHLVFPFDAAANEAIKALGAEWWPRRHYWSLPLDQLEVARKALSDNGFEVVEGWGTAA